MSDINSNIITVKSILKEPFFEGFKVLASSGKLDNKVSGGNIMDNPNALDWFKSEEILVTSGYFLTTYPKEQRRVLEGFKNLNISAIFIKPSSFFEKLPKTIIDYCDEFEIPLVEVPYGIAFSSIINKISSFLSTTKDEEKQLALDSHNLFFKSALDGGGVERIVKDLSSKLESEIIISDSDWKILSFDRFSDKDISFFTHKNDSLQFDKESLEDLPLRINEIKNTIYRNFKKDSKTIMCKITPITFNTINYGYIVIPSDKPISNMDRVVLESATMALALEISQQSEIERYNNRVIRDFFKHLLSGEKIDSTLLQSVGLKIDYNASYSFIIMHINIKNSDSISLIQKKKIENSSMEKVLDDINRFSYDTNVNFQVFKQGNEIFGVLEEIDTLSSDENKKQKSAFFAQLLDFINIKQNQSLNINVMIGSPRLLNNLKKSYEEAIRIKSFSVMVDQSVYFYDDFYFELFLANNISEQQEVEFYSHYLDPLIKHDINTEAELMKTLREYLNNQYNVADTSRRLFIHRNTMIYRLNKIEELLNVSLNDADDTLALKLAFRFHDKKIILNDMD